MNVAAPRRVAPFGLLRRRVRAASLRAVAAAAGIVLALSSLPLVFGLFYFGNDASHTDLGTLCELRLLDAANQPSWLSPRMGDGGALFARPSAQLLYPFRAMLRSLPVDWDMSLFIVLHLVLAAAAATWLARSFRVRPLVACGAGVAYVASGAVVDLVTHSSYYLQSAVWLPLLWVAGRYALGQRSQALARLVVAASLALCLLGGEPHAAGVGIALLGFEIVHRVWRASQRAVLFRRTLRVLVAVMAGVAVGAVPWFAFMGETGISTRGRGLELSRILQWSYGPPEWLATLVSGPLFTDLSWLSGYSTLEVTSTWNPSPYLGAAAVAAWIAGCTLRRSRLPAVISGVLLLSALGRFTPFYGALITVFPPLGLFRYPQKYLLATSLTALMVIAIIFDGAHKDRRVRRRLVLALFTMASGMALLLFGAWMQGDTLEVVLAQVQGGGPLLGSLLRGMAMSGAICAAGGAWVLWARARRRAAILLISLDLLVHAVDSLPVGPGLSDLQSPIAHLPRAEPAILCTDASVYSLRLSLPGAQDQLWAREALHRLYVVPERQACDGMVGAAPYSPLVSRIATTLLAGDHGLTASEARSLGCNLLVTSDEGLTQGVERERFDSLPSEAARRLARGGLPVFHIRDPIPRHAIVRDPHLLSDEATVMQAMAHSATAADALAIMDDPLQRLGARRELPDGTGLDLERVDWAVPDRATLHVTGHGGGVLVLRTAFLAGWQATQAGLELPVIRASGHHLGVLVDDATQGPVELRYRSPHLGLSVAVAVAGILVLGLNVCGGLLRRRFTQAGRSG
ncbi:MAG: hypothetical protein ABIJ09_26250 [Pseudomonadota bacterium]